MTLLNREGVPFMVGGAYALACYAGIERHTKDLDLFVRRADVDRLLAALEHAGCRTEHTFPHWLAKAFRGDHMLDLIYSSGNGVAEVDDSWFEHAPADEVQGVAVRLCPPEEMLWQKSFIMERERFDGADIAHLIRARAESLDWHRLLDRFGSRDARVLFAHLILFGYIYPAERERVPDWVMEELLRRIRFEPSPGDPREFRGTLLSRAQYLVDVDLWGYRDGRLRPEGGMTTNDVAHWTAAIDAH